MKKYIAAKLSQPKQLALDAVCGISVTIDIPLNKTKSKEVLDENNTNGENDQSNDQINDTSNDHSNDNLVNNLNKLHGKRKKLDYEIASEQFRRGVTAALNDLDVLAQSQVDSHFLIMQALANMITALTKALVEVEQRYTMAAFGLANLLASKLIHESFEQVARFEPNNPFLKIEDNLSEEASEAAQKCLIKFVETKRKMLSDLMTDGMQTVNWLEARIPHDVSVPTAIVLQELSAGWVQLSSLLSDTESKSSHNSSVSSRPRSTYSGFSGSLNSNITPMFHGLREDNVCQIDRLFTNVNRLHLSKPPSFNCKSVLSSIAIYTMKTMLELVRATVFNCAGFNQMQVDAYFIYGVLFDKVQDPQLFVALIDEMLSSAAERTVDPIPFQTIVLQDIFMRSNQKPVEDVKKLSIKIKNFFIYH